MSAIDGEPPTVASRRGRELFSLGSVWATPFLLALVVVAVAWSLWIKEQALRELRLQRLEVVRVLAGIADRSAREKLDGIEAIAARLGWGWTGRPRAELQAELDGLRAVLQFPTLFVVSAAGVPLAFSPLLAPDGSPNLALRYGDRPYLREAVRTGRLAVSTIALGRAAREPVVAAAVPIRSRGAAVAYLVGTVALQGGMHAMEQAVGGVTGWLALVDREGMAARIEPAGRRLVLEDWRGHPVPTVVKKPQAADFIRFGDEEALVAQASIASLGLDLALVGSVDSLLARERRLFMIVMVTLVASVAVSLITATVMGVGFLRQDRRAR